MDFRRALSAEEAEQWEDLMNLIIDVRITEGGDKVTWVLEKSGIYTTKSMYRMLAHRGVVNYRMRKVWGSKIPLKIKIFLWLAMQNRLQTGVNLKGRKWKGSHMCMICNAPETTDHILFFLHHCEIHLVLHQGSSGMGKDPGRHAESHG